MRAKRPYIVLSFRTTVEAMAWEKHCEAEHIPGRLIPLPRSQYPGPFDSAATGALGRVRPCVADAARGLAAVAEPHRPRCL